MSGLVDVRARAESKRDPVLLLCGFSHQVLFSNPDRERSVQQVTERLDRLIRRIKDIQRPHMYGPDPADIVIVCFSRIPFRRGHSFMLLHETNHCGIRRWHTVLSSAVSSIAGLAMRSRTGRH